MTSAGTMLLTATAVHFGFRATVTTLVHPALARVPTGQWAGAHQAYSRAIVPVVALVYGRFWPASGSRECSIPADFEPGLPAMTGFGWADVKPYVWLVDRGTVGGAFTIGPPTRGNHCTGETRPA